MLSRRKLVTSEADFRLDMLRYRNLVNDCLTRNFYDYHDRRHEWNFLKIVILFHDCLMVKKSRLYLIFNLLIPTIA